MNKMNVVKQAEKSEPSFCCCYLVGDCSRLDVILCTPMDGAVGSYVVWNAGIARCCSCV